MTMRPLLVAAVMRAMAVLALQPVQLTAQCWQGPVANTA